MFPTDRRQFLLASGSAAAASALLLAGGAIAVEPAKPTRRIVALGGAGFQVNDHDHLILKYILSLTGKKNPLICFIPTAGGDSPDSIVNWYSIAEEVDCRPRHLKLINNASYLVGFEKELLSMDAIFVGGGNTRNMLSIWKTQGVDVLLRKAWEQGIVLSGGSAGMICWFEHGVADSMPGPMQVDDGLGFLKGNVCPHYAHHDRFGQLNWKESFSRLLLAGKIGDGYACEDDVGMVYEDDKLVKFISDRPKAKAFLVRRVGDKIVEEPQKVEYIGK